MYYIICDVRRNRFILTVVTGSETVPSFILTLYWHGSFFIVMCAVMQCMHIYYYSPYLLLLFRHYYSLSQQSGSDSILYLYICVETFINTKVFMLNVCQICCTCDIYKCLFLIVFYSCLVSHWLMNGTESPCLTDWTWRIWMNSLSCS